MNNNSFYPKRIMRKVAAKATPLTDTLGAIFGGGIPYVGAIASPIGGLYGILDKDRYDQQTAGRAFIPGVGSARLINRLKSQVGKEIRDTENNPDDKDVKPVRHAISEQFGPVTSTLAATGIGAGLGGLIGRSARNAGKGALIGAATGISGNILGSILAAIKRRRTAREQIENDKKSIMRDLLIPGVGSYNKNKRLGRSQGDRDELEASKKGKTEKKAYIESFNKTAKENGVNPYMLYKSASKLNLFRALSRYFELLAGGNIKKLEGYNEFIKGLKNSIKTAPTAARAKILKEMLKNVPKATKRGTNQTFVNGSDTFKATKDIADELAGVTSARRNSLIGLGLLGSYGLGVSDGEDSKKNKFLGLF